MSEVSRVKAIQHVMATLFSAQNALRELAPEYKWAGMGMGFPRSPGHSTDHVRRAFPSCSSSTHCFTSAFSMAPCRHLKGGPTEWQDD